MPYAKPIAFPRRSSGNAFESTEITTGKISAEAAPCTTRKAITTPAVGASPQTSAAAEKTPRPIRSASRRPKMSPTRPPKIRSDPTASMLPLITHWRSLVAMSKSLAMRGKARLTTK